MAVIAGALTVVLTIATPAVAHEATITCGTVVTTNLTLHADLMCTGDALSVGADGITIDLAGHTISGAGTGTGISAVRHSGLTVRNGTVADFATDVYLEGSAKAALVRVTIRGGVGIRTLAADDARLTRLVLQNTNLIINISARVTITQLQGSHAQLTIVESNHASITRSVLTDTPISLFESDALALTDSTLTRSTVDLLISSDAFIRHNRIRDADNGIAIGSTSAGSQIIDNAFTGNGVGTLVTVQLVAEIDRTVITGNRFTRNGAAGVLLDITQGILGTPTVSISANRFSHNGANPQGRTDSLGLPVADGAHIVAPAGSPITVADNVTRRNARYGIFAQPGTVIDGGGNRSTGDPLGCLGVVCR
jgi:nitrous oxidase accessory protein NosD